MRTTLRIEDRLLADLKEEARREGLSMTKLIERVLRRGMAAIRQDRRPPCDYREKTFAMGQPRVNLDKATALAALMEEEEVRRKLSERK
ncbi:MAG: ribbon-helix-helix protein, CopG family [Pirellulales bacterium]|nr:ribbon-helix-helix protein, CopG family [Pirellulales bacterium]